MKISTVRMISLAALATFAGTGLMQAAPQATFHLSVPAHWGQALLQPGDYSMFLPVPSAGESNLRVVGGGKTILAFPVAVEERAKATSSYLQLSEIDGNYFVREFSSGAAGQVFVFSVPKRLKR